MERKAYPSDLSDEEWGFVAPYLIVMTEEAPQHNYSLRGVQRAALAGAGKKPPGVSPTDLSMAISRRRSLILVSKVLTMLVTPISVINIFMSVDLPAPFSPKRA